MNGSRQLINKEPIEWLCNCLQTKYLYLNFEWSEGALHSSVGKWAVFRSYLIIDLNNTKPGNNKVTNSRHQGTHRNRKNPGPKQVDGYTPPHSTESLEAPTPMMAPVMVWVVLTGIPICSVINKVNEPADSAQTPSSADTLVILVPMVLQFSIPTSWYQVQWLYNMQGEPMAGPWVQLKHRIKIRMCCYISSPDNTHYLLSIIATMANTKGCWWNELQLFEHLRNPVGIGCLYNFRIDIGKYKDCNYCHNTPYQNTVVCLMNGFFPFLTSTSWSMSLAMVLAIADAKFNFIIVLIKGFYFTNDEFLSARSAATAGSSAAFFFNLSIL